MTARLIDGKAAAAEIRAEVQSGVARFAAAAGRPPGLATVMVGDDPASAVYVAAKQRACTEVGMRPFDERLAGGAGQEQVARAIARLCAEDAVDGILLQLPLPAGLDAQALIAAIDPAKDVDGLTPRNAGLLALGQPGLRPCTPLGAMELLKRAGARFDGAEAVVVGRSNLFGKPMAALLLAAHATVTICHSYTRALADVCGRADLLIVASGQAEMVKGDWIKPGAIVIDVGITRLAPAPGEQRGRLVGDVDFAAGAEVATAITPVPGGVGPMTIAMLLRNTLQAARARTEGIAL